MEQNFSSLFHQDALKVIAVCPLCEAPAQSMKAAVLEEGRESHLVHMTCGKCSHALLAVVVSVHGGISSLGVLTDLQADEVVKYRRASPLCFDDVLAIHQWLQANPAALARENTPIPSNPA